MNTDEIKEAVRQKTVAGLDASSEYDDIEIKNAIEKAMIKVSEKVYIKSGIQRSIVEEVYNGIRGMDILQPLLDDPDINEIMVMGRDKIYTERRGIMKREKLYFESDERLAEIIRAIIAGTGRTVNEASPIVDSRLADGSRINAVLPPVSIDGPILTIRKFPDKSYRLNDLVGFDTITDEAAEFLRGIVKNRFNIFICGGTSTGKTTFLNALAHEIPQGERIITVEDSAELSIKSLDNIVRLETRNANAEGKGAVGIRDLIRTSLRMRPDRIIVGEVRGAEALDMLQAMNTGHEGSMSTGHANSAIDMLYRLETMVLFGSDIPIAAIRQQIQSSIDIIIHLGRDAGMRRCVTEIDELGAIEHGNIRLNRLYTGMGAERGFTGNKMSRVYKRSVYV